MLWEWLYMEIGVFGNLVDDRELQIALQDYINKNYSEDNPYYLEE